MARPQIPDVVKNRIEAIHKQHRGYEANSFQEALSTVADLAENEIQDTELNEKLPFQYEVEDTGSEIELQLLPESDSDISCSDVGLETPKFQVNSSEITDELNQIGGVDTSVVRGVHDGINVILEKDTERPFNEIIDDVFTTLAMLIQQQEDRIDQIEQRADQYASRKDSTDQ